MGTSIDFRRWGTRCMVESSASGSPKSIQTLAFQVEPTVVEQETEALPERSVGEPAVIALADLEKSFGRRIGIAIEQDIFHGTKNIYPSFVF